MQYSIWVVPPEPLYTQLKEVVETLAKKYGGPIFDPHLTILGPIDKDISEIEKVFAEIAKGLSTLDLSLGSVSFSTTHFQSVFVRVNSTAALMDINLKAKELLGMNNNVFMPHISMLYGDHDMKIREEAVSEVDLPPTTFKVKEFVVTPVGSGPSEWEVLTTIPFGQ